MSDFALSNDGIVVATRVIPERWCWRCRGHEFSLIIGGLIECADCGADQRHTPRPVVSSTPREASE